MGERVLLVEGQDDQHVMWNLFEVRGLPEVFEVKRPEADSNGGESIIVALALIPFTGPVIPQMILSKTKESDGRKILKVREWVVSPDESAAVPLVCRSATDRDTLL